MSIGIAVPVTFTDKDVEQIAKALNVDTNPDRLSLFPLVLREWAQVDLMEYDSVEALGGSIPLENARYGRVASSVKELIDAIDAVIAAGDLVLIAREMAPPEDPVPTHEQHWRFSQKLMEHRDFLNRLKAAVERLKNRLKKGPGRPRNIVAYFVLQDIGTLFSWLTGLQPSREVDRASGKEKGAFYDFAAAIWPPVFASGLDGLPAAMKNWDIGYRRYGERSALLANVQLRHPTRRLLNR
jgi:hypothetical protein